MNIFSMYLKFGWLGIFLQISCSSTLEDYCLYVCLYQRNPQTLEEIKETLVFVMFSGQWPPGKIWVVPCSHNFLPFDWQSNCLYIYRQSAHQIELKFHGQIHYVTLQGRFPKVSTLSWSLIGQAIYAYLWMSRWLDWAKICWMNLMALSRPDKLMIMLHLISSIYWPQIGWVISTHLLKKIYLKIKLKIWWSKSS